MARYTENSRLPKGLMLCNYNPNQGAVTIESINAFLDHSKYPVFPYSLGNGFDPDFPYDKFDFIIIHYSIIPTLAGFLTDSVIQRLVEYKGPIVQFVQDDYRRHGIMREFMARIGVSAVYSIMPQEAADKMYRDVTPNVAIHSYLAGYASTYLHLEKTVPLSKRKIDIGYRGREYPYWFGEMTNHKIDSARLLGKAFSKSWAKVDFSIREKDRIYGRDWVKFLLQCRAIYGTESEVSNLDLDGSMAHYYKTMEDLNKAPRRKKDKWDGREIAESDFFKEHTQPGPADMAIIPPRVLEVMSLRCVNILMEGDYSGILVPWRHYIPVKRDLSNVKEVLKFLRNSSKVSEMIAIAYAEIATNEKYMWQGFGTFVDQTLEPILADVTPLPTVRMVSEAQLNLLTGPFYYSGNPHIRTVSNPSRVGARYWIMRKLRILWRGLLERYRKMQG